MVSAFHFEPLNILRWLPLFFNLLTVITFVLVSWELLHDRLVTVFSSAVFALLPRSSEWVIMGGGLTRSPGFFLALAALWFAIRFTKTENLKSLIISALLCSASFLIHLEWGLSATLFVIFYLVLISPPQKRIFSLNIVGWTILILTSPWWAFVVHRYGTSPLLGALGTSGWNIRLSFLNITNLEFLGLVSYMGWVTIIGIVLQVQKRSWFLPLLLPLLQLSTPRHAQTPATIPVALLSGIALTQLTQLFIEFLHKSFSILQYRAKPIAIIIVLIISVCYLQWTAQFYFEASSARTLTQQERDAFDWISKNTPQNANFVILSQENEWYADFSAEWFPYLSKRVSSVTSQGMEWLPIGSFMNRIQSTNRLKELFEIDPSAIPDYLSEYFPTVNYVVIIQIGEIIQHKNYPSFSNFNLVYNNDYVLVYKIGY